MHISKQLTIIKSLLNNNVITNKEYDDLKIFLSSFPSKDSPVKKESTKTDIEIESSLNTYTLDSSENKNNNKESSAKHVSYITKQTDNKGKSKTLVIIASIILVLILAAMSYYFYTEKTHSDNLIIEQRNKFKADSTIAAEKINQNTVAKQEEKTPSNLVNNSSNLSGNFPYASQRLLTSSDIKGLSKQELKIMRNEIFARHGYIFKTEEMKSYFSNQSWYIGQNDDVSSFISTIEKQNIELIKKYE